MVPPILNRSLFLIIISLYLFTACGFLEDSEKKVAVSINEKEILIDEFTRDFKRFANGIGLRDQESSELIYPILEKLINHYVILEWGRQNGMVVTDNELQTFTNKIVEDYKDKNFEEILLEQYLDMEEWREGIKEQLLVKKILSRVSENISPVSMNDIKDYYDSHKADFRNETMVRFRQILLRTEKEAEDISAKLAKGEDMGELAKQYSKSPEGEDGGEVGWVSKGDLEESMEKAIFALSTDKISRVVKTPYGYHIFQVLAKRSEGVRSLPEVINEIEAKLSYEKKESYIDEWLKKLTNTYKVKVNKTIINRMEFE